MQMLCALVLATGCGSDPLGRLVETGQSGASAPAPAASDSAVLGAQALSNHYVAVTFNSETPTDADDASQYIITEPDGTSLSVSAADLMGDGTGVVLTTDAQHTVQYQLTFKPVAVSRLAAQTTTATGSGGGSVTTTFRGSRQRRALPCQRDCAR